jgi:hypothetical protein
MSKKFIFLNGLFFFIPFFGTAMEQENMLSAINTRTLHRILHRDPVLAAKIFRYTKKEDRKKMLYELKRADIPQMSSRKRVSCFRYKPYPTFHKRKIVDL